MIGGSTRGARLAARGRGAQVGRPLDVIVIVDAAADVTVDAIEAQLFACFTSGGSTHELPLARQVIVPDERRLIAGRHEVPVRLELPATLPPSFDVGDAAWHYELALRLDVPWARDPAVRYELPVLAADGEDLPPPQPFAAERGDGRGRPLVAVEAVHEPKELVLRVTTLDPMASSKIVTMLVGSVTCVGKSDTVTSVNLRGDARPVGPLTFEVTFARERALPSSFVTPGTTSRWTAIVVASRDSDGAGNADNPGDPADPADNVAVSIIDVRWRPPRPSASAPARSLPPPLPHHAPLGEHAAVLGRAHGLVAVDDELRGALHGCALMIHREVAGPEARLLGRVSFAPLELGLHAVGVTQAVRPVAGAFANLVDVRRARDPAQARAWLGELAAAPLLLHELGDEHARLEGHDDGDPARLEGFLTALAALCRRLGAERDRFPPPARFADDVPAWRQLAQALDGAFVPASMRVHGQHAGRATDVGIVWSRRGAPTGLRLRVATPALDLARARAHPDAAGLDLAGSAIARTWDELRLDPDAVLAELARLSRLAHALRQDAGTYR